MKPIDKPKITFDPHEDKESTLSKIFKCKCATVLWCCIKSCHIVDQHFNDLILSVGLELEKVRSEYPRYRTFLSICSKLTHKFGVVIIESGFNNVDKETDHEFWCAIYEMCFKSRYFKIEYSGKMESGQQQ